MIKKEKEEFKNEILIQYFLNCDFVEDINIVDIRIEIICIKSENLIIRECRRRDFSKKVNIIPIILSHGV